MRVSGPMLRSIVALSTPLDMKIQATPGHLNLAHLRLQKLDSESTTFALIKFSVLEEVRATTSLLKKKVTSSLRTLVKLWIKIVLHLSRFEEPTLFHRLKTTLRQPPILVNIE